MSLSLASSSQKSSFFSLPNSTITIIPPHLNKIYFLNHLFECILLTGIIGLKSCSYTTLFLLCENSGKDKTKNKKRLVVTRAGDRWWKHYKGCLGGFSCGRDKTSNTHNLIGEVYFDSCFLFSPQTITSQATKAWWEVLRRRERLMAWPLGRKEKKPIFQASPRWHACSREAPPLGFIAFSSKSAINPCNPIAFQKPCLLAHEAPGRHLDINHDIPLSETLLMMPVIRDFCSECPVSCPELQHRARKKRSKKQELQGNRVPGQSTFSENRDQQSPASHYFISQWVGCTLVRGIVNSWAKFNTIKATN